MAQMAQTTISKPTRQARHRVDEKCPCICKVIEGLRGRTATEEKGREGRTCLSGVCVVFVLLVRLVEVFVVLT